MHINELHMAKLIMYTYSIHVDALIGPRNLGIYAYFVFPHVWYNSYVIG